MKKNQQGILLSGIEIFWKPCGIGIDFKRLKRDFIIFPTRPIVTPMIITEKNMYIVNPRPRTVYATKSALIDEAGVATKNASIGPNLAPFL